MFQYSLNENNWSNYFHIVLIFVKLEPIISKQNNFRGTIFQILFYENRPTRQSMSISHLIVHVERGAVSEGVGVDKGVG